MKVVKIKRCFQHDLELSERIDMLVIPRGVKSEIDNALWQALFRCLPKDRERGTIADLLTVGFDLHIRDDYVNKGEI